VRQDQRNLNFFFGGEKMFLVVKPNNHQMQMIQTLLHIAEWVGERTTRDRTTKSYNGA
jgi:hypothetical protein